MTCNAIDRITGKRCSLPAHSGEHSASGRRFRESLAPGEIPLRPLDLLATLHEAPEEYESGDRRVKNREAQRRSRRRMVVNREGVP